MMRSSAIIRLAVAADVHSIIARDPSSSTSRETRDRCRRLEAATGRIYLRPTQGNDLCPQPRRFDYDRVKNSKASLSFSLSATRF